MKKLMESIKRIFAKIKENVYVRRLLENKSYRSVFPFLGCIAIAFVVWFYVMFLKAPQYTVHYTDIPVTMTGLPSQYETYDIRLYTETLDVTFTGTNFDIAKCELGEVVAHVDLSSVNGAGSYALRPTFIFPNDAALTAVDSVVVEISMTAPKLQTRYFQGIRIEIMDKERENFPYQIVPDPLEIDTVLSSADDAFLNVRSEDIVAVVDVSSLSFETAGRYSSIPLKFEIAGGIALSDPPNLYVAVDLVPIAE